MSLPTVKAIAFDCGGVILSNAWNSRGGEPSYDVIPKRLGISKERGNEIFHKYWPGIRVGKEGENAFFQGLINVAKRRISLKELRKLYYGCILKKDAFEIIERLHKKYPVLPLYALNDEGKEWMNIRIRKFGLKRFFKDFITSGYVGYAKPDKRIYEILIERADAKAGDCLFIDNKKSLLVPAREMGFQTILFTSKQRLERDLRSYGIDL